MQVLLVACLLISSLTLKQFYNRGSGISVSDFNSGIHKLSVIALATDFAVKYEVIKKSAWAEYEKTFIESATNLNALAASVMGRICRLFLLLINALCV